MVTTTTLRSWWSPACSGPLTRVDLHGAGRVSVRTSIVPAVHALNACLVAWDYRTRLADTGAYNCRKITGGTNYSLHAYGTALDLNWQSNPYGSRLVTDMPRDMVQAIKAIRTNNGKQVWRWGGDYSGNKDAMHYEIVCHPNDLATGIDPSTLPGGVSQEDDDMPLTDEDIEKVADRVVWKLVGDNPVWLDLRLVKLMQHSTGLRDSIASLVRRITGTKEVTDGSAQHDEDRQTGSGIQRVIDG